MTATTDTACAGKPMTTKVDLDALDALHAEREFVIAACPLAFGMRDADEWRARMAREDAKRTPAILAELRRARKIEAAARTVMVTVRNACDTQTRHAMLDRLDHALALDAPDESGER